VSKKIENLFSRSEIIEPEFNFWYLMRYAPKYTHMTTKVLTYPIVFLAVGFSLLGIGGEFYDYVKSDYGFDSVVIMACLLSLGLGITIWVSFGRHGQKKEAQLTYNQLFQRENSTQNESKWSFSLEGDKELANRLEELSRGDHYIARVNNILTQNNGDKLIQIGDLIRAEYGTSLKKNFRDDISFVFISAKTLFSDSKFVLTDQSEIHQWVEDKLAINLDILDDYKLTLRVKNEAVLIEFHQIIFSQAKKLALGDLLFTKENAST